MLSVFVRCCILEAYELALLILLGFHCLIRVEELFSIQWSHIHALGDFEREAYRDVFAIVEIGNPKTRRNPAHARRQFAVINCPYVASFGAVLKSRVPWDRRHLVVFLYLLHCAFSIWKQSVKAIKDDSSLFTMAGLRGGGATDHSLLHKDIPSLCRRGRWSDAKTLEHYVQEGVYVLSTHTLPTDIEAQLNNLASLATGVSEEVVTSG